MMKALVFPVLGIWALLNAVVKLAANLVKVLWELLKTALDTFLKVLPIILPAFAIAGRGSGGACVGLARADGISFSAFGVRTSNPAHRGSATTHGFRAGCLSICTE